MSARQCFGSRPVREALLESSRVGRAIQLPRGHSISAGVALRHANEIRIGRARLKRDLASGRVRIEDVIAVPPEFARTAKVYDLLLALPKVGPVKASRSLTRYRVAPSKTVGGLTDRQRHELIGLFRRHTVRQAGRRSSGVVVELVD